LFVVLFVLFIVVLFVVVSVVVLMVLLVILLTCNVKSLDDIFHIKNDNEVSLLTLDTNGNLEVIGEITSNGNISSNGYCNCMIPSTNIPSMIYPKQNYLPVITNINGEIWTQYTNQVGRYIVIGNYVNLQIFLTWGNNSVFFTS